MAMKTTRTDDTQETRSSSETERREPVYANVNPHGNKASAKQGDRESMTNVDPNTGEETYPNRDAITGTPGSHPVGVGIGAAAAGATGAAIGSVVPGVGTAVGAAIGAVVGAVGGGYAGKGVAEQIYPTEEDAYWREEYPRREYADRDRGYTYDIDYKDAYRFGYLAAHRYADYDFETVEPSLIEDWSQQHGSSRLEWSVARSAVRDAWTRARTSQHSTPSGRP
jgi:uncharacterized protein YcfJ